MSDFLTKKQTWGMLVSHETHKNNHRGESTPKKLFSNIANTAYKAESSSRDNV